MNNKFLSLLGLAQRAGQLKLGMDSIKQAMMDSKIKAVFIANDISENSKSKIVSAAKEFNLNVIQTQASKDEIERAIGKHTAIIGVLDENFANGLKNIIASAAM